MKITITQINGEADNALERDLRDLSFHIADQRPDLVLLPEMPFYRWLPVVQRPNPYEWRQSMTVHNDHIRQIGKLGAPIVAGTIPTWPDGDERFNTGFIWTLRDGVQHLHDKVYLPDEEGVWEQSWYSPGPPLFASMQAGGARLAYTICSEIWFLNLARDYGKAGVQLLLAPRATEGATFEKWKACGTTAAVVGGVFHASSNRVGTTALDTTFGGGGWLISPDGDTLAVTSEDEPFVTVDIDLSQATAARSTYPRYLGD